MTEAEQIVLIQKIYLGVAALLVVLGFGLWSADLWRMGSQLKKFIKGEE